MSGLEVAGVVLGSIPLLISGLEHYAQGVQTIGRLIRYKWELKSLVNTLKTEDSIFKNTCETLLDGLARPSMIESLLKDPGGKEWQSPDLGRELENRLGDSYNVFFDNVTAIHEAIKAFQEKLCLGPDGKVEFQEKDALRQAWKVGKIVLSKGYYDDLISRIKDHNVALKRLTSQSTQLEKSRRGRRQIKNLGHLKRYAIGIHQAVGASFKCLCRDQHHAGLSLDQDESSGMSPEEDAIQFKVVISGVAIQASNIQNWEELRIQVVLMSQSHPGRDLSRTTNVEAGPLSAVSKPKITKRVGFAITPFTQTSLPAHKSAQDLTVQMTSVSTSPSVLDAQFSGPVSFNILEAKDITNLCEKLRAPHQIVSPKLLGMLSDQNATRFIVHHWKSIGEDAPPRILSLQQILSSKRSTKAHLSRSQKLKLAGTLSFAVLSLYHTPWMQSVPTRKDILFLNGSRRPDDRAFISTPISHSAELNETEMAPFFIHNSTLFALGILLIEILFESPIEELKTEKDDAAAFSPWHMQFAIAKRLLEEERILEEGGPDYESAVHRCVWCNFNPQFRRMDLEDEEFRAEVYDNVVAVLKDVERNFHQVRS